MAAASASASASANATASATPSSDGADITTPELLAVISTAIGRPIDRAQPIIGAGLSNRMFRLFDSSSAPPWQCILRVYSKDSPQGIPEAATMEWLHTVGAEPAGSPWLPLCARMLTKDLSKDTFPFMYMVQEYVAGTVQNITNLHDPAQHVIEDAAHLLHRIHTLPVAPPPLEGGLLTRSQQIFSMPAPLFHAAVALLGGSDSVSSAMRAAYDAAVSASTPYISYYANLPRVHLTHGDPNIGNFVRAPLPASAPASTRGELRLLDWELASTAHYARDLAWFICANDLSPEREAEFLRVYASLPSSPWSVRCTSVGSEAVGVGATDATRHEHEQQVCLWLHKLNRLAMLISFLGLLGQGKGWAKRDKTEDDKQKAIETATPAAPPAAAATATATATPTSTGDAKEVKVATTASSSSSSSSSATTAAAAAAAATTASDGVDDAPPPLHGTPRGNELFAHWLFDKMCAQFRRAAHHPPTLASSSSSS